MGKVISVNVSLRKGTAKSAVAEIELVAGLGVKGDAHSAPGDRQVSLLMEESLERARAMTKPGAKPVELRPGSFAENLTTSGLDLLALSLGDLLHTNRGVRLRVSKKGKECPRPCAIYYQMGDCLMPREGIFCEVLEGGAVRPGDELETG